MIIKEKNDKKECLINSNWMKNKLFEYFRFKRQFIYCCTEGINYADFLALNEDCLVEVEVKISQSDLLREFKSKDHCKINKHHRYFNAQSLLGKNELMSKKHFFVSIPNYFYLAVTEDLVEYAKEEISKINNNYGIILISTKDYNRKSPVMILKTAKKLHDYKPNGKTFYYIGKRATSELATLRQKYLI